VHHNPENVLSDSDIYVGKIVPFCSRSLKINLNIIIKESNFNSMFLPVFFSHSLLPLQVKPNSFEL